MAVRATIYCRLSQDRAGAGVVVARQERECRALAAQLGWSVVEVLVDNDVSASDRRRRRPGYQALLHAIDEGCVDAVLAWHTDRLHRQPRELEDYIDACEKHGVVTATVRSGHLDLTTDAGQMVARMLGAAAKYEARQTAGRSKAGKREAAARGRWGGGRRPYGYDVVKAAERRPDEPSLRPRPAEADVVREAARRVLAGESLRSLAVEFNGRGLPTADGALWTGSALRKVLLRPLNAAFRPAPDGGLHQGGWAPLLDEATWRGLHALLMDPQRRTTDRRARKYLGSGLYRCVCGSPMTGNSIGGGWSGRGAGGRKPAYVCRDATRGLKPGQQHVVRAVDRLDEYVTEVILTRLAMTDAREVFTPPSVDLGPVLTERAALGARLGELGREYAAGRVPLIAFTSASQDLQDQIEVLESQIAAAHGASPVEALVTADDVREAWSGLSLDRRRAIVDLLITVNLLPRRPGGRVKGGGYFDPESVRIGWRRGERYDKPLAGATA